MATVVAHKTIKALQDLADKNTGKTVADLNERKTVVPYESSINIGLKNNGLVILKTGLYYVYTGIGVKLIMGNNSSEIICTTLFYYLYRVNAMIDMMTTVLARSLQICTDFKQEEKVSYIGGVFKLYSGDKIEVHLHGLHQFKLIPQSSFVGLFMVKPEP
ncbi:tumor necrosis factor ligand superfamily member 6-like [Physella acuta]|uniref:tumor necrosis factor ligand superfamily member 6-like n=1 Tax=Physella acuta TaxID=109671 RepID=UPI0027DB4949|nr:tumor necrosis factor ligand superfamily member 6-like [Physella acuta]